MGAIGAFMQQDTPESWGTCFCFMAMAVTHQMQNLFTDALFTKNLPSDIRGVFCGLYQFFGSLGVMLYSLLGAHVFDLYGPQAPFLCVGLLDLIWMLLVLIMYITPSVSFNQ